MKPNLCAFRCGLALLVVIAASFAMSHEAHNAQVKPEEIEASKLSEINENYLKVVKPLFQKACFDCHSSTTNQPWYGKLPGAKQLIASDIAEAREHMDMSNDFPFEGHSTPKEDLEAIAKAITDKSMPPFRYRIMHPSSALSDDEQKKVQEWVEMSLKEF